MLYYVYAPRINEHIYTNTYNRRLGHKLTLNLVQRPTSALVILNHSPAADEFVNQLLIVKASDDSVTNRRVKAEFDSCLDINKVLIIIYYFEMHCIQCNPLPHIN